MKSMKGNRKVATYIIVLLMMAMLLPHAAIGAQSADDADKATKAEMIAQEDIESVSSEQVETLAVTPMENSGIGGVSSASDVGTTMAVPTRKDKSVLQAARDSIYSAGISVGDTVTFGTFPQATDGGTGFITQPITWRVLESSQGELFLLSEKILYSAKFRNDGNGDNTWVNSNIYRWLNVDFYNTAFSSAEKGIVKTSTVATPQNPGWGGTAEPDVNCKVFLPSYQEMTDSAHGFELLGNGWAASASRITTGTDYANSMNPLVRNVYWLRTHGSNRHSYIIVDTQGGFGSNGSMGAPQNNSIFGIRPAIKVGRTLGLLKEAENTFGRPGDSVDFKVSFSLPVNATGIDGLMVYDALPTTLDFASADVVITDDAAGNAVGIPVTATTAENDGKVSLTIEPTEWSAYLGGQTEVTLHAIVSSAWTAADGDIENTAKLFVQTGASPPDPETDEAHESAVGTATYVQPPEPPSSFTKTATSGGMFAGAGDSVTYEISLVIPSDITGYEGLIVYDALPEALTLTGAAANVMHSGSPIPIESSKLSVIGAAGASSVTLTLDATDLAAYKGDSVIITVEATIGSSWQGGSISNEASWYIVTDEANPPVPGTTPPGGTTDPEVITQEPPPPPPPTLANYTVFHYRVDSSDRVVATESETKTGTIGSTVTATPKTYVGYTFNANHVGTARSGNVLEDGSLELKLYYKVSTFTVTFRDYNRKSIKTQLVEYGKNATAPPKPSRQGYTFTGWNKAKSAWQNVKSNVVVTATYKAAPTISKPATFTVTFRDYNSRIISKQTVEEGKSATRPANPTRSGYTFAGWDKESSAWKNVKANIIVTATYRANTPPNPPNPPTPLTPPITTNPVGTGDGGGTGTTVIVNQPAEPVETTPDDEGTELQDSDEVTVLTPDDDIIGGIGTGAESGADADTDADTGTDSTIDDERTPLASNDSSNKGGSWSLFDLICSIIAVVFALIATIIFVRRESEEDDGSGKRKPWLLLLALLLAGVCVVLFVLTQDIKLPMTLFDRWSIIFAICALVGILLSCLASGRKRETQMN